VKFQQALDLNPNAVGTILNVALCDEKANKLATAQRLYEKARALADENKLAEHSKAATEKLEEIKRRVPHVAFAFTEQPMPQGTKLVVDDEVIDVAKAADVPVNPGTITVVVSAPGRVPYETKLSTAEGAPPQAVAIPKLGYPVTVKRTRQTVGKVLTFVGVGLFVAANGLAIWARHDWGKAIGKCTKNADGSYVCDTTASDGSNPYQQATDDYNIANYSSYVGGAGLAIAAAGAFLWFFGPKDQEERKVSFVPTLDPTQAGIAAMGRF
jgi:hypothetical protein